jgi:hypothetical protein
LQPRLETAEPLGYCLPGSDVGVRRDNERERTLHRREGIHYLHQAAQLDLFREVTRCDRDNRKDDCYLGIACREPCETLLALHDLPKVFEHAVESLIEDVELDALTSIESDAFRVFAHPHQTETKVSFEPLAGKV